MEYGMEYTIACVNSKNLVLTLIVTVVKTSKIYNNLFVSDLTTLSPQEQQIVAYVHAWWDMYNI